MPNWDASFETLPPDTEDISQGASRITDHKEAVRERAATEHVWGPGSPATLGNHLMGSARPFIGAAPDPLNLTAPDTPTDYSATSSGVALANSDALHNGRLWIDTTQADQPLLKFWNGATLTFDQVMALSSGIGVDVGAVMLAEDVQAHPIAITFPNDPATIDLGFTVAVTTPVSGNWRIRVNAVVHVEYTGDPNRIASAAIRLMEDSGAPVEVDSGFYGAQHPGVGTGYRPRVQIVLDFTNNAPALATTFTYTMEGQYEADGAITAGQGTLNFAPGGTFGAYRSHLRAWIEPR
jgi:hypothetical protein